MLGPRSRRGNEELAVPVPPPPWAALTRNGAEKKSHPRAPCLPLQPALGRTTQSMPLVPTSDPRFSNQVMLYLLMSPTQQNLLRWEVYQHNTYLGRLTLNNRSEITEMDNFPDTWHHRGIGGFRRVFFKSIHTAAFPSHRPVFLRTHSLHPGKGTIGSLPARWLCLLGCIDLWSWGENGLWKSIVHLWVFSKADSGFDCHVIIQNPGWV